MYNSIWEAVRAHAVQTPEKLAAADKERVFSYRELWAASEKTARALQELGVHEGDPVPVECTQDVGFLILDLACGIIGAVFVPVEEKAAQERVLSVLGETGAKVMIAATEYSLGRPVYRPEEVLREVSVCGLADFGKCGESKEADREESNSRESVASESAVTEPVAAGAASAKAGLKESNTAESSEAELDTAGKTAEILFTTGTTGRPKGIMISNRANIAIAENIQYGTRMSTDNVELVPMPLSHSHGLRTCYANLLNGSAVVLIDGVMNVALFFRMIERYHVTALDLSPTLAKLLLKVARKGLVKYSGQMDYLEIGTSFLDDDLKERLKEIFPASRLYNFYGSTEAGRTCVLDFNEMDFSGCIGYPAKNASFLIVDDERRPMKSCRENPGLVAMKGSMMMDGYLGSEELTRSVLSDGVLYSSDLGYIDEAGRVYVLGRRDDVINYKGIKIAPDEIETAAIQYPGIRDCACIPVRDAVRGQVPKLYVVAGEGYSEESLFMFLKTHLEPSRVPVYIQTIDEIPHSSNGKLQRKKLRELEEKNQKNS